MAKRWFICPVIGKGTDEDGFRPKVADMAINGYTTEYPSDMTWSICVVDADDFTELDKDPELKPIGDASLDKVLDPAIFTKVIADVVEKGVDTSGKAGTLGQATARDVVKKVGDKLGLANIDQKLTI